MWSERIITQGKDIARALRANPAEVIIGISAATIMTMVIAHVEGMREAPQHLLPMLLLGLIISHALSVMSLFNVITARVRWTLNAVYLAALGVYGFWGFDPSLNSDLWRWGLVVAASVCAFSLIPLTITRRLSASRELFWSINAKLIARIVIVSAYLLAMYLGLTLAWTAIRELLGVTLLGHRTPEYMFVWLFMGAGPWLIAAGMPKLKAQDQLHANARRAIHLLVHALVMPLTLLYLGILYLYNIKIVIEGLAEAPKNIMSPLVLVAAGLVIVGMMLAEQLRLGATTARCTFVRVIEWLPTAFLPLLPLALWAVLIRVGQYGWTEFRYVRVAILVAVTAVFITATIQKLRGRQQPLAGIMAIFAITAILSAVGPWSAREVSLQDQLDRFKQEMKAQHQLSPQGQLLLAADPEKANAESSQRGRQFYYLCEHFGMQTILAQMQTPPTDLLKRDCYALGYRLGVGSKYHSGEKNAPELLYSQRAQAHELPVAGVMWSNLFVYSNQEMLEHRATTKIKAQLEPSPLFMGLDLQETKLIVELDDQRLSGSLDSAMHQVIKSKGERQPMVSYTVELYDEQQQVRAYWLIEQLSLQRKRGEPWRVESVTGSLLHKR